MQAPALTLLDGARWHGRPVPGERAHLLLAALALEPSRGVGDRRLAEEVWGEDPPANPAKALQVLVSRTRSHTAAEVVARTSQGYRLGLSADEVDCLCLAEHARSARAALSAGDLETAGERARAGSSVQLREPAAEADDPVNRLRQRARRDHADCREVLGRALSGLGRHDEALPLLEGALADRPGDEPLLEATLSSEAVVRGAGAALARYERFRAGLRDRLGTDPGARLQTLHGELLALDRPVREGVRHDASRLIGRDHDVTALAATIRSSRVTSIVGAGGLGKTRLAHVLGRSAEQPVVHFVELAGVTTPDGVAVEVGSALGVRDPVAGRRLYDAAQRADLHARILERLGRAPTLLILDNCEHVVEAVADLVSVLVARAPALRVLTTSRAPLGLAAERVYPLSQLRRDDAAELFRERATAARPGVRLDDDRVAALVERLDGLPLAVELAAAKVRVMSVEEIERRLENRFALLRGGARDAPARHQTLLAVIDWSWNLLDGDERRALRRLSVFRDGCSLDAAAALVGGPDVGGPNVGGPDVVGSLTTLVDQSLVTVEDGATLRYRLLETVREFGRMQLVDAGDDAEAERRLRGWARHLAVDAMPRVFSAEQVATMAAVRAEEGNLTDVLRRALADHDAVTVVPVMGLLAAFWTVSGDHLKVVNVAGPVERLVVDQPVPPELEDHLRGVLAAVATNNLIFGGSPGEACLARLKELGAGTGDRRLSGWVRVLLTLGESGPEDQVRALTDLCQDPEPAVAMLAYQWTSQARENSGDLDGALEAARAALELYDGQGGPWQRALLSSQLAGLAAQTGDVAGARACAEEALVPMEQLGASEDASQLRALLAICDIREGRLEAAAAMFDRLEVEDRTESLFGSRMIVLCGRAELELALGRVTEGLVLYERAVDALTEHPAVPGLEIEPGLEPWVMWPQAAAVAAHARHDPSRAVWLRDDLLAKAVRILDASTRHLDFPVSGAVAFALGCWELAGDRARVDDATAERGVRLLALADRFAYNRVLPSLDWVPAAELAERVRPGLLAAARSGYVDEPVQDLRVAMSRLLSELEPAASGHIFRL